MIVIRTVSWSSWRVSGVFSCWTWLSIPEIWPTSVDIPVPVTTISPRPRVTVEFMYAMSRRSPSGTSSPGTGSTAFSTGVLSPVSADSSISSVAATSRRPSAGTLSPASNVTMSPGTSSSDGMSTRSPPRRACALITSIFWSAATLSAALPSWLRPRIALSTVSPRITMPVLNSCSATMLTIAAPTSTSCIRSRYWRRNACQPGSFSASTSLFGPYSARRRSTSAASEPGAAHRRRAAPHVPGRQVVPRGVGRAVGPSAVISRHRPSVRPTSSPLVMLGTARVREQPIRPSARVEPGDQRAHVAHVPRDGRHDTRRICQDDDESHVSRATSSGQTHAEIRPVRDAGRSRGHPSRQREVRWTGSAAPTPTGRRSRPWLSAPPRRSGQGGHNRHRDRRRPEDDGIRNDSGR